MSLAAMEEVAISADFQGRLDKCVRKLAQFRGRPIEGARFLDIGSGCGNMLIAAASAGASRCVGIEPFPFLNYTTEAQHHQALNDYRLALAKFKIPHSAIEIRACGVEDVADLDGQFDIVMLFDVLEHVPDPALAFRQAFRMTAPGGFCYSSTAPLYYSMNGHHLAKYVRVDPAWVHLRPGFERVIDGLALRKRKGFAGLNRVTASKLVSFARKAGFQVARRRLSQKGAERLVWLRAEAPDLAGISDEDLLTEQCQLVLRKPEQSAH